MSLENIRKIQDKYAWFIKNEQLALVERLSSGELGSVTENTHTLRVNVSKLADHFTGADAGVDSYLPNVMLNPEFTEVGGAGVFDDWTDSGTVTIDVGSYKTTPNSAYLLVSSTPYVKQSLTLTPGKTYRVSFYLYSDALGQPAFEIYDETNTEVFYSKTDYPTLASWNQYNYEFTVPSNGELYTFKFYNMPGIGTGTRVDSVLLEEQVSGFHEYLLESPEFPEQFHMAIVYKTLSDFYKLPNMKDLEMSQYFELEYMKFIKKAKTYSKANHIRTGRIVPQEF